MERDEFHLFINAKSGGFARHLARREKRKLQSVPVYSGRETESALSIFLLDRSSKIMLALLNTLVLYWSTIQLCLATL